MDWSRKDFLASACGDNRIRIFRPEDCCPHTCQGSSIGSPILAAGPFGRSRRKALAPCDCWLKTTTTSVWIVLPAPQSAGGVYKVRQAFPMGCARACSSAAQQHQPTLAFNKNISECRQSHDWQQAVCLLQGAASTGQKDLVSYNCTMTVCKAAGSMEFASATWGGSKTP